MTKNSELSPASWDRGAPPSQQHWNSWWGFVRCGFNEAGSLGWQLTVRCRVFKLHLLLHAYIALCEPPPASSATSIWLLDPHSCYLGTLENECYNDCLFSRGMAQQWIRGSSAKTIKGWKSHASHVMPLLKVQRWDLYTCAHSEPQ